MTTPFPTDSRKSNFTVVQEDMAFDLNAISTYLHQIIKDRNVNFFVNQQVGYFPGCVVNGCIPTLKAVPNKVNVSISSGLLLFSSLVDADNYSGSLVPITAGGVGTINLPASGKFVMYTLDITYSENIDPGSATSRNFYNAPNDLVSAKSANIHTVPSYSYALVAGPEVADPLQVSQYPVANGYNRIANFVVSSTGIYRDINMAIPYIWNLQNWPGSPAVPHAQNSATTYTLADCLSAVRAQLAYLTTCDWYSGPAIDLKTAKTLLDDAQTTVNNLKLGFKGMSVLRAGLPSTYTVPAGCSKLYIRMWGPGGNGGNGAFALVLVSLRAWGGGGGSGAYIEDVMNVTPGQVINYRVGAGGSGNPTTFGSYSAGAGGNGGNASIPNTGTVIDGTGGTGGTPTATSSTAVLLPGLQGSILGYGDGRAAPNMTCIDYFHRAGKATPSPMFGCGGGGCAGGFSNTKVWPPVVNTPGGTGGDGIILVYYA
ncbi:Uncharacterised protein [uncultured archaeon]|nr:Uncharacterised protein [uncultured archaeon]